MTQQHGLTWGALDFVSQVPTADGYRIEALSEGTSLGNPQPIIEVVKSLLTDGSIAVLQNWDNRDAPIRLRLSAPVATAGPALAAAEKALFLNVLSDSPPPLVWTPPADDAAVSVFDVVVARLDRDESEGWDEEEVQREYRYYLLTLTCLPFARPETTVVVPTTIPPATVIDTCDSLVNWFAPSAALSTTGGYVQAQRFSATTMLLNRLNLPATMGPFLRISATLVNGDAVSFSTGDAGGADLSDAPILATEASAIAGATDYYISTLDGAQSIQFRATRAASGTLTLRIHQIDSLAALPIIGTARQQARLVEVGGSAPTQAALRVSDSTPAALGTEILVHSSDHAFVPSLRPRRVSSATVTTDAAMVSGARNTLTSAMTFRIPAASVAEATYGLLARLNVTVAGTLAWSARMVDAEGVATVGSSVTATGSASVAVTSGYQIAALGALILPVLDAEGSQMVELTLTGTANMTFDEGWLFNLDDGALTWIKDADSLTWIEIRSPELDSPRPAVFGGVGAKGTNPVCIDWKCESFGAHRFDPGQMQVFTVTSTSLVSQSEMEYYRRYHSNVLDEAA